LRADAEDCALIGKLATDAKKRDLFNRLGQRPRGMASDVQAMIALKHAGPDSDVKKPQPGLKIGVSDEFFNARDDSLIAFYESVRRQVQADRQSGGRYRFVGESTRRYAETLREEMDRRRMRFTPIDWHR
jgi:hypothetical protein